MLRLARKAIESRFTGKEPAQGRFATLPGQGLFVTLTKEGELRGCIGSTEARGSLGEMLVAAARGAAFDDPRFPPLTAEELGEIRIEVSLLTPPRQLRGDPATLLEQVVVGRDGVILRQRFHQALLLPQVAVEYGWNNETLLEQACLKAGLAREAWKEPKTAISVFQAEIFSEE